ncbi:adenosylmethionine decarboxylase [Roseospira goensis]|uniref:S-adenosylmethionine decarboxylase proenzyme n=1 Tax=Roseospira goensis TaxID=391922 RepID=A0A7W6WJH9_9PROT|nr:adenosylmethionine decarboxylase [Roseospira goensis]MBB4284522.1 S-adenosylmethionine decarboxylase [Roseospira goensis]
MATSAFRPDATRPGTAAQGEASRETPAEGLHVVPGPDPDPEPEPGSPEGNGKDYFIERDGVRFAGTHLLVDLWGASGLDDLDRTERALTDAARAAGATLLHTHLHHFTPNGGISGVLVLAESHISIHTWPERSYAALDIFMCGAADPYKSIPVLRAAFTPETVTLAENKRGLVL